MAFEVADNIADLSFASAVKNLIGVCMVFIAFLKLISRIIDTWYMTKINFKTNFKSARKKKTVEGSLGYNHFSKKIQFYSSDVLNDESSVPSTRKILRSVVLNKHNMTNFLIIAIIGISLVFYNQIFRVILLSQINMINFSRLKRHSLYKMYPLICKGLSTITILFLIGYIYSLSEMFFMDSMTNEFDVDE